MDSVFSNNGHDLYQIAVLMAGFDAKELMREICKMQRDWSRKVSARTVENAMAAIADRDPEYQARRKAERDAR